MQIIKNISALFGASLASQLILILVMPFLARHYPVSAFGEWALFVAISSTLSTISSFRYDVSIILPKKKFEARQLLGLAICLSILSSTAVLAIVGILYCLDMLISIIYLLIPISMIMNGIIQIFVTWLNRLKKYKQIAGSKIVQSLSNASINVLFVILFEQNLSSGDLVYATIIGQLAGLLWLLWPTILSAGKSRFMLLDLQKSKELLIKYKDFPLYSTPEALVGVVSAMLPLYAVTYYFTSQEAGYLSLSLKVLMLPVSIIGGVASVVLAQRFSAKVADGENISNEMIRIWLISALLGLGPALIMTFYGVEIFTKFFGESWNVSGQIASSLSIYTYLILIFSITSSAHVALRMQHISLAFALLSILSKCMLAYLFNNDMLEMLIVFTSVDLFAVVSMNAIVIFKHKNY